MVIALGSALGAVAGALLWGMVSDLVGMLGRWLDSRAKPPTPHQLNLVARAMRKRAADLDIKAEKLRAAL